MILQWIQKKLLQRLDRKKKEIIRLRWQKEQLRQQLDRIKREKSE